jgi:hypothetical protein
MPAVQLNGYQLKTGDILLSEGTSFRVKVGQALFSHNHSGGQSNVTHASIFDGPNQAALMSAVPRIGVWRFENDRPGMVYHVYRYAGPNAVSIAYEAIQRARQYVMQTEDARNDPKGFGRYSDLKAASSLTHSSSFGPGARKAVAKLREDPFCQKTFFCSQFVIQCYQLAVQPQAPPPISADLRYTSPKELQARLNRDTNWQYVGYYVTTGRAPSPPPSPRISPTRSPVRSPSLSPTSERSPSPPPVDTGFPIVDLSTPQSRAALAQVLSDLRDERQVPVLPVDISHVNPNGAARGRSDNCQACAVAVDATLGGYPMTAAARQSGEAAMPARLEEIYGTRFQRAEDWDTLLAAGDRLGPGTRFIVSMARPVAMQTAGHVFNLVMDEYNYPAIIDGQVNETYRLQHEIVQYFESAALTHGIQFIATNASAAVESRSRSPSPPPQRRVLRVTNAGSDSDSD